MACPAWPVVPIADSITWKTGQKVVFFDKWQLEYLYPSYQFKNALFLAPDWCGRVDVHPLLVHLRERNVRKSLSVNPFTHSEHQSPVCSLTLLLITAKTSSLFEIHVSSSWIYSLYIIFSILVMGCGTSKVLPEPLKIGFVSFVKSVVGYSHQRK